MKKLTEDRLNSAKEVSKESLIEKIKTADPIRFDQMLIEKEERKTYFFVKYSAQAYTRKPKTLKFPLFPDLLNDFERNISSSGETSILEDDEIIHKIIAKGKTPTETPKYTSKILAFSELKLATEGDRIKINQPIYYLPNETVRSTCNTCKGDKYTTCTESECRGQHIYDCNVCRTTGQTDCKKCRARGQYQCPSCHGKGRLKCTSCGGSGNNRDSNSILSKCKTCNGSGERKCSSLSGHGIMGAAVKKTAGKKYCGGSGIIRCKNCSETGKVTCEKCEGDGKIECQTCYGDHVDDRYGKVDCKTCETAGELASISYIETEIKSDNLDLIFTDGKKIDAPGFGIDSIKKLADSNGQMNLTYKNLNGDNTENYDVYSTSCSKDALTAVGSSKEKYPKLISEEMYYEGVPCATFNYNHILSASSHDVSVLSIDKDKEVVFHSNPTAVVEEKESSKQKVIELLRKAFSTKAYKDKIDRKHEMFLMIHMAKADGVIEDQEKRYISKTITGLDDFTNKEKAEVFGLMSGGELPPISPTNAYFSSKERAEEAKKKLVELVAKADGDYEPEEKLKLDEINNAIDLGFKAKPSSIGRFFKTWQISVSLILLLVLILIGTYNGLVIYPELKAENETRFQSELAELDEDFNSLPNIEESSNPSNESLESSNNKNNEESAENTEALTEALEERTVQAVQLTEKIPSTDEKYPDDYEGPEAGMWLMTGVMDNSFSEVRASSTLAQQGKNSYGTENLSDDNPETAWVEGKDDYGIGETLELMNGGTRITIYNGYQRDNNSFYNNSRVKKFKVYFDGKAVGFVELADSPGAQIMDLEDLNLEDSFPEKIKLEIVEVYEGKKWSDTAISQIFYVGG